LSDDLVAKARAIASRSDELLQLLEDARQKLVDSGGQSETTGQQATPQRRFRADSAPPEIKEPAPEPELELRAPDTGDERVSEGLRLLTTQMSVAGAGREEIAAALKEEFGIDDVDPILKSIGL
jgi:hypothetical protein